MQYTYCSLAKECPWAVHLTRSAHLQRGVGTLFSDSAFIYYMNEHVCTLHLCVLSIGIHHSPQQP